MVPHGAFITPTVESNYFTPDTPDTLSSCIGTTVGLSRLAESTKCAEEKTPTKAISAHGSIEVLFGTIVLCTDDLPDACRNMAGCDPEPMEAKATDLEIGEERFTGA